MMLSLMLIMMMAVEVNVSISSSFDEIRILTLILGVKFTFQPPLELSWLTKRRYYAMKLQPIDRAAQDDSKTPLIALIPLLQAKIWRIGWIWREWVMRVIEWWSSDGGWSYHKGSIVFSIESAFEWDEPLFTFQRSLQAKILGETWIWIVWVVSPPRINCTTL
jgi:hypothetical protein